MTCRFHTQFKKLARGRKNILASVAVHYALLEQSMQMRAESLHSWARPARKSTPAGHAARLDSSIRMDRLTRPLGGGTSYQLTDVEFQEVQHLWKAESSEYRAFWAEFQQAQRNLARVDRVSFGQWRGLDERPITASEKKWQAMSRQVTSYARVEYAGNEFRTQESQGTNKHDNAVLREDYYTSKRRFH